MKPIFLRFTSPAEHLAKMEQLSPRRRVFAAGFKTPGFKTAECAFAGNAMACAGHCRSDCACCHRCFSRPTVSSAAFLFTKFDAELDFLHPPAGVGSAKPEVIADDRVRHLKRRILARIHRSDMTVNRA